MTNKFVAERKYGIPRRLGLSRSDRSLFGIAALVVVVTLAGFGALAASAAPAGPVTATLVTADGAKYVNYATISYLFNPNPLPYMHNDNYRALSIQVPSGTQPVSIQAFRTNPDGSLTQGKNFTWNMASTGYNYVVNNTASLASGKYSVYAVVTFADGTQSKSNAVTFTIMMSLPPVIAEPSQYP